MNANTYILIVEDSKTQAEQLKYILEANGYSTEIAVNGLEALNKIRDSEPTIVISDILMPQMDGYDLCKKIKADDSLRDIPFILLTSLSDPEDVIKGLQAGADNFITKPYNEDFLISRVRYILLNRELRRQSVPGMGVEIVFAGNKYFINSDRMQIIDLLLSTYENAIQKNGELAKANQELTRMHRELARKNGELEKLNEEKNKYLGMAAHDLRNPLSVILGFSEFLMEEMEGVVNEKQNEFLSIIKSSSEFMLQMVNDLLDISQIEAGKLQLDKEMYYIIPFVDHTISLNNIWAEKKKIKISFHYDDRRIKIPIDPHKMEQVLNNLISNAIKYSPPESSIEVNVASSENSILISIRDEGQGIPANEIDNLFKPFSKTSVKGTAGEKSTGLGLLIARRIVEGHNGKIWVESEIGKGSAFFVSLPVKDEAQA